MTWARVMPAEWKHESRYRGPRLRVGRLRSWPDISLARNSGMTLGKSPSASSAARLSPLLWRVPKVRCRCPRRDVDAHPSSRGSGRRLEGESGWLEIQEARCDRCRRGAQQWSLCAATALRAQGVNVDARQPDAAGSQSIAAGHKIAARGRRKAAWRSAKGLREPDGVPRKACRGLPGRFGPGPGLPRWRPRTRRTPSPHGRDGRRVRRASPFIQPSQGSKRC